MEVSIKLPLNKVEVCWKFAGSLVEVYWKFDDALHKLSKGLLNMQIETSTLTCETST